MYVYARSSHEWSSASDLFYIYILPKILPFSTKVGVDLNNQNKKIKRNKQQQQHKQQPATEKAYRYTNHMSFGKGNLSSKMARVIVFQTYLNR